MKLIVFFLIATCCTVNANAQKCKLTVNEVDAYTKEHVKSGTTLIGGMFSNWTFTLKQEGSVYGWEMYMQIPKHIPESFKKGDIIYCKLENGKVIELMPDNDYAPSHMGNSNGVVTIYQPKGKFDVAVMKDFSESEMDGMRITISGDVTEPKITSKQGASIQKVAKCILMP